MKTNVTMTRRMGQFEVNQRTKDGYFNATHLLKQWNKEKGSKKQMIHFTSLESTKTFIEVIKAKERDSVLLQTRGKNGGSWMTPMLFIDFAMWLNPEFKYDVLRFVYDQLIDLRNDAGDHYKELTNSVQRFEGIDFPQLARGLNWLIFNKHEKGIRQKATKDQLSKLNDLQKKLAFACDMGYINSFNGLLEEMRRLYNLKY